MKKDIIISILAAELILQHPWYTGSSGSERVALIVGTATVVFIFLLFLEDLGDKFRKYRNRVRKMKRIVKRLEKGIPDGNHKTGLY